MHCDMEVEAKQMVFITTIEIQPKTQTLKPLLCRDPLSDKNI